MQKCLHARVTGRVQMVMFRDFTRRAARRLGLVGEVKNLPDGSVEVCAEGEEQKLNELLLHLKKGPLLARVDDINVEWMEPNGQWKSFDIIYG